MANYATLKGLIDQYITTNGQGDITGAVLNDVLKNIVNSIGADFLFGGVVVPSSNVGTPDQNVFYIATQGGQYQYFDETIIPNGITIFKWNGSWSYQIIFAGDGGVFDITAYHNGTKYADLTAALGIDGANVPESLQRGGMSVMFVRSSDNKYVVYRLMGLDFTTDINQWQSVDEKVDKVAGKSLIDSDFASAQSAINNPEYFQVVLDDDGKPIEGITTNWKRVINIPVKTPSAVIDYADNPEYVSVIEDEEGKIVSGRNKDGVLIEKVGVRAPIGDFDNLNLSEKGLVELKESLDLDGENKGSILSLHPREVVLPILKTFKDRPSWFLPYSENYKYINFNMLWFSDLHHVERRLARIKVFYAEYAEQIDCVLCSGDAVNTFGESFDFWHNIGADSFLNVIGNHECLGGERTVGNKVLPGWIPPGFSPKECYDKFFKDYISNTGITIPDNKCYWYKDYTIENGYKIRVIGIDYYHWKESRTYSDGTQMEQWPDGQPLDNGAQQIWFRNLLADSLTNDYSVICVMHNPVTNSDFEKENTPFQALEPYLIDPDFSHTDILDEVQTFINNGGKFITWLTGHTHDDRFGKIKSHPQQLMITVGTAGNLIQAPGDRWEFPSFMDRTENTMNDDLFDIVSINTFAHTITLVRIGSPYDKHGRKMDSIAYDYINKNIL